MKSADPTPESDAAARSEFERRVATLLNDSAAAIDGRTRSALTRARFAALEQAGSRQSASRRAFRYWAPAGAVAMGVLAVMFYAGERNGERLTSVEDLALVTDADAYEISNDTSPDMDLEQDSDFYEWAVASAGNEQGLGS